MSSPGRARPAQPSTASRHGRSRASRRSGASLRRRAEADAQRGRQRARAQPPLLPAAVDQRRRLGAVAHPQRADALGAVDLVRRRWRPGRALRRSSMRPKPWTASHSISAPCSCASRAISATGWMTPISLLTSITATSSTRSSMRRGKQIEIDQAVRADRQDGRLRRPAPPAIRRCRAPRHARSRP